VPINRLRHSRRINPNSRAASNETTNPNDTLKRLLQGNVKVDKINAISVDLGINNSDILSDMMIENLETDNLETANLGTEEKRYESVDIVQFHYSGSMNDYFE
jgi:hypothetical protein